MLVDFSHERLSAGRPVAPELWRCVGRFADAAMIGDLARVLRTGTEAERAAAALALGDCPRPEARAALAEAPALETAVREGRISWGTVAATA
jgi:hypothetical protein